MMTEEEVMNHPEFKMVRKIMKREFKWIKDVILDGDPARYSSLVFLEVIMDPWECAEIEGLHVASYIKKNDKVWNSMSFSTMFKEDYGTPIVTKIKDELENICISVHKSPAFPKEFKMENHKFSIGNFSVVGTNKNI